MNSYVWHDFSFKFHVVEVVMLYNVRHIYIYTYLHIHTIYTYICSISFQSATGDCALF